MAKPLTKPSRPVKRSSPSSKPAVTHQGGGNGGAKLSLLNENGQAETNGYKLGLQPPKQVEVYYDSRDRSLWYRVNGRFLSLGKSDLLMFMRNLGLREKIYFDGQREIDWPIFEAMNKRIVDYAGSLAGHRVGVFKDGSGRNYLVTEEANGVFEQNKQLSLEDGLKPEFLISFFMELLGFEQCTIFFHWLAVTLRALRDSSFTPGWVLVLAGEPGCGKSLCQDIITEIFGGRVGKPFDYMIGNTNFNREFCGAEHWQIGDPRGSRAMQERVDFGARLKEGTVEKNYKIHQKGKDAIDLALLRRITISINLELEYLSVLPPMDTSIKDKISLFLCNFVKDTFAPIREKSGELDRKKIWACVMREISAFRLWLLKTYKVNQILPEHRDDRFVIKAWHHPELITALSSISHEMRLLELIDDLYFSADGEEAALTVAVEKKSGDVQKELLEKNSFEAGKILRYPGACGSHLGKLARSHPERVSKRVVNGTTIWTINPPVKETKQ